MSETDEMVEEDGGGEQWRAGFGAPQRVYGYLRRMAGRAQEPKLPALSTGACDGAQIVSGISSTHRLTTLACPFAFPRFIPRNRPLRSTHAPSQVRAERSPISNLQQHSSARRAATRTSHHSCQRTPSGPVMGLARRSLFPGTRCHPSSHRCPCQSRPSEGYNLFALVGLSLVHMYRQGSSVGPSRSPLPHRLPSAASSHCRSGCAAALQ